MIKFSTLHSGYQIQGSLQELLGYWGSHSLLLLDSRLFPVRTFLRKFNDLLCGEGEQKCWFGEEDAMNRVRWRVGVGGIAVRVG